MRYILTICLLFMLALPAYAEQGFFSTMQDMPLMAGLEELTDHGVSFDKPEGRIIESLAIMHEVTEQQVLEFYQSTLPQFGWGVVDGDSFFRNNEFLEISFEENNGAKLVKIMVKPVR